MTRICTSAPSMMVLVSACDNRPVRNDIEAPVDERHQLRRKHGANLSRVNTAVRSTS